jgi:hypothetical protein
MPCHSIPCQNSCRSKHDISFIDQVPTSHISCILLLSDLMIKIFTLKIFMVDFHQLLDKESIIITDNNPYNPIIYMDVN